MSIYYGVFGLKVNFVYDNSYQLRINYHNLVSNSSRKAENERNLDNLLKLSFHVFSSLNNLKFKTKIESKLYNDFSENVCLYLTAHFKGKYKELIDKLLCLKGEDGQEIYEREILERIGPKVVSNILNRKDAIGFFYEITNKHNVTSSLVGTCHIPGTIQYAVSSLPTGTLDRVIEKSEKFISELGEQLSVEVGVDGTLTKLAKEKKIEIFALDLRQDQINFLNQLNQKINENPIYKLKEDEKWRKSHGKKNMEIELFEAWQNGDIKDVDYLTKIDHPVIVNACHGRTEKWINNGLTKELVETKIPICVAVGMAHISKIIEIAKKLGLEIRLNGKSL